MARNRPRKFRNEPTIVDGHKFDSKREANRFTELLVLERAGEIANIELQPKFPLQVLRMIDGTPTHVDIKIRSKGFPNGRRCSYRADFRFQCLRTGKQIVEDVKGFDDDRARFKRAVVEAVFGIEIALV